MFSILLTVGLAIQGYFIGFPGFFEQELIISFLPYIIGFNSIIIGILVLVMIFTQKKRFLVLMIGYIIIGYLIYATYQETYTQKTISDTIYGNHNISFFYANIYYQNQQTEQLTSLIASSNPDVIMLVEYSKSHDELLTPLLKKIYPYVSRYVGSKGYDGDIIFSKYPIKTISHTTIPGSFSHITLSYTTTQEIDIALIHTSAPVSKKFFQMRSTQLEELDTLITNYYSGDNINRKLILAGDFNITPWSSYYTTQMKLPFERMGLTNITTNTSSTIYNRDIPYTRCLSKADFLCAHIDHIRSNLTNIQLKQITIPGSDHYGFIGTLTLP